MSQHYIFTVKGPRYSKLTAGEVLEARLSQGAWPINRKTPHRSKLKEGDRVVFYVAGAQGELGMHFASHAELSSAVAERSRTESRSRNWLGTLADTRLEVGLAWSEWFDNPVSAKELLESLSFVKNTKYWGAHFMGGVTRIPSSDYELIVRQARSQQGQSPGL